MLSVWASMVQAEDVYKWTQNRWTSTVAYRADVVAPTSMEGTVRLTAVDEYTFYLNGTPVGSDSVWTSVERYEVALEEGTNQIAIHVVNRGRGHGNGLLFHLTADDADTVQVVSDVGQSGIVWYWNGEAQAGTAWTTADPTVEEGWRLVQYGTMDREMWDEALGDSASGAREVRVIAGFPGDVDVGSAGGIAPSSGGIGLKWVAGDNLAVGRPGNQQKAYDGNLKSEWTPGVSALNRYADIDLQRPRLVDRVEVIAQSLLGYSIQVSDDQFRWIEVGLIHGLKDVERSSVSFPAVRARYVRLVIAEIDGRTAPEIAEIIVLGSGYASEGTYTSSPLDLSQSDVRKNLGRVRWDAEVPPGTEVSLRFRSGLAADDSTAWSEPVQVVGRDTTGVLFPSPEPATWVQYRVWMRSEEETVTPVFREISFEYGTDIAATSASGRITPLEVPMGRDTTFVYHLSLTLGDRDEGVKRIVIATPSPAVLEEIVGLPADVADGVQVTSGPDRLTLDLPRPLVQTDGVETLTIRFRGSTYVPLFAFRSYLYAPGSENPLNVGEDTESDPETGETGSWSVLAREVIRSILLGVQAQPRVITPNGDGVNDEAVVEFVLAKVAEARVTIAVYDAFGGWIRTLHDRRISAGVYPTWPGAPGFWDGTDGDGETVPPGIYLVRVKVDTDAEEAVAVGTVIVVY